ncbi:MAG: hypothetical protein KDD59_00030 [Bdellovibrionales bacterium]|nr:hypothetical protein [Bdellovibrionales bacterium]
MERYHGSRHRVFLVLLLAALTACQLADNKIYGTIKNQTTVAEVPSGPPTLSVINSSFLLDNNSVIRNTPVSVTVTTRDQYGDPIYDASTTITASMAGNATDAWLSTITDNTDGTYSVTFYAEVSAISRTLNFAVDGHAITSADPVFTVAEPRLAFTGNSHPSASIAARTVNETMSPAWTLTGLCDVSLGEVVITSPSATDQNVSCAPSGGGTFAATYNYTATAPFLTTGNIGVAHFYIKQNSLQPKRTWIYVTQLSNPPSLITNLAGLQAIAVNDATKFYILDSDISSSGADNWTPIGDVGPQSFTGVFDGNNHTVDGLNRQNANNASIFAKLDGQVSNLKVINADFRGAYYSGGIAGWMNNGAIRHVSVSGRIESVSNRAGGVVGWGTGSIAYATVSADIVGSNYAGGIYGDVSSGADYVFSSGTVSSTGTSAGIGKGSSYIRYATSTATVSSTQTGTCTFNSASGIGTSQAVYNSFFDGTVVGTDCASGLLSNWLGMGYYIFNLGNVSATGVSPETGFLFSVTPAFPPAAAYYLDTATCSPTCTIATGESKTALELKQRSTYQGWDLYSIWRVDDESDTPRLRWIDNLGEYIP